MVFLQFVNLVEQGNCEEWGGIELRVSRLRLGEQQARLFHITEQLVFGEDVVEALRSEPVFAAFKRQHVPNLPLPAGPSSNSGFCNFAARKTILVITGSMKYPVALSRSISSSKDSNILSP
jgi:hypothetical protein